MDDFPTAVLDVEVNRRFPEWEIENALEAYINDRYPHLKVTRQWRGYKGSGIPDLMTLYDAGRYRALTVIEIKANRAGEKAFHQLERYVEAARRIEPKDLSVFGVLAAPRLAYGLPRPDWFAWWPLYLRETE